MADCFSGNMSVILSPESKMTRMACWAHARRHVYEHQHYDATASALPLALINKIYDVERRATGMSIATKNQPFSQGGWSGCGFLIATCGLAD